MIVSAGLLLLSILALQAGAQSGKPPGGPPILVVPAPPPRILLAPPPPAPAPPALSRRARPRFALPSLVSSDDYPVAALRADEEGTVGFSLSVGADGLVSGCTVTASSGSVSLDGTTCRILRARASFEPALDLAGRPAPDSYSARIRWNIEDEQPAVVHAVPLNPIDSLIGRRDYPPAARRARRAGVVGYTLYVDWHGRVTECEVTRSSGSPALDNATCALLQARARFTPARDASGNAVSDEFAGQYAWRLPGRGRRR